MPFLAHLHANLHLPVPETSAMVLKYQPYVLYLPYIAQTHAQTEVPMSCAQLAINGNARASERRPTFARNATTTTYPHAGL